MGRILPIAREPHIPSPPPPPPAPDPVQTDEAEQARRRAQALAERERGRLGTILTSFTGVLTPNNARPQRKTLLGE